MAVLSTFADVLAAVQSASSANELAELERMARDLIDTEEDGLHLVAALDERRGTLGDVGIDWLEPTKPPVVFDPDEALHERMLRELQAYVDGAAMLVDAAEMSRQVAGKHWRDEFLAAFAAQYTALTGKSCNVSALFADKGQAQRKAEHEAKCLALIASCHDGDELRGAVLKKLRPMVASSAALLDKVARQLASRYAEITGAKGMWTAMMAAKALRERPRASTPASVVELTHVGVAQTMIREEDGNLRTIVEFGSNSWIRWDGCKWVPLADKQLGTLVAERLDTITSEVKADDRFDEKAAREIVRTLGHTSFNAGVCAALAHQRAAHVSAAELDARPEYLAVANGAVHIETGELVARKDLLLTLQNAVVYNPEARCPAFLKVLGDMFPEGSADREWVELVFGYTMVGLPVEKAMFFHKGAGDNGKSLLLNAIMGAMGAHATASSFALIAGDGRGDGDDDGNRPSPMLHNLRARRMAYIDEIPQGKVLKEGFVKQVAGGLGSLQGRRLGGQLETFPISVVVHVSCNNIALVRGNQRAAWERICPVVYTAEFKGKQQDTHLPEKLRKEQEGILSWLLQCAGKYLRLKASGETLKRKMPESARAELEALKKEQNQMLEWMEQCCIVTPNGFVSSREAVESYNAYARSLDEKSSSTFKSVKAFVKRMKEERIEGVYHNEQAVTEQLKGHRQSGFMGLTLRDRPQYMASKTAAQRARQAELEALED